MKWASLTVCALGGALLVLVGCQQLGLDVGVSEPGLEPLASVRTFDGTPDQVAVRLQAMLKQRKFEAAISGTGDDVVVESSIAEFKRSSFLVQHRLCRGEELAVEGHETRVWTVHDPERRGRLKSQAIPDEVKAALS